MDSFWAIAGIGVFVFLSFAGGALFYWVVSRSDSDKKG
jgi:hypothetical protein